MEAFPEPVGNKSTQILKTRTHPHYSPDSLTSLLGLGLMIWVKGSVGGQLYSISVTT